MLLDRLSDLPHAPRRAVIINVSTRWVTTLALLSALRYVRMPVLVIDCESKDGSPEHFAGLMREQEFDFLPAPLMLHGHTLDRLFREVPAEDVLLIDSDAEVLGRPILDLIDASFRHPQVFGAGFVHGPEWLTAVQGFPDGRLALYQERMWIPFAMLNVPKVREALDAGRSFIHGEIFNDFPQYLPLSRWLYGRFRRKRWASYRLKFLNPFRRAYYNAKPSYVYCDTGAEIYQYLKYDRGYYFAGLPAAVHGDYVAHYHGITRRSLDAEDLNAAAVDDVMATVLNRLRDEYGCGPLSACVRPR
jgi:hypothetical protein